MKKILLAVTALALLAGPAVAQQDKSATQAQQKDPNAVWCNGQYLGSDPDPNVRIQLLKDYGCKHTN